MTGIATTRAMLLPRIIDGTATTADEGRFKRLTQRMRELYPRVTDADRQALAETTQRIADGSSVLEGLKHTMAIEDEAP